MLLAFPTCIWGLHPIPLCRASQALPGWMGSVAAQLFSGLSRDVWSGSCPSSGWATQGHSETCPEATPALSLLCAYGRCPIGRWTFAPVWGPELSGAGFNQGSICTLRRSSFPSILTSLPVPAAEKHPHRMMLPPPCFTVEMILARWWAVPGFLQMWHIVFRPNSSIFISSDQRILFLMVWQSFTCLLANSKQAVMCLLLRSGFCLAIKAWLVQCCRNGCPSGRFSHFSSIQTDATPQ